MAYTLTMAVNILLQAASPLCTIISRASANASVGQDNERIAPQAERAFQHFKAALAGTDYPKTLLAAADQLLGGWANQAALKNKLPHPDDRSARFSTIINVALKNPATYVDFLELAYIALSLGFQGSYGSEPLDNFERETMMDRLYQCVKTHRGEVPRSLSPHLFPEATDKPKRFSIPLWFTAAMTLILTIAIWSAPQYRINQYAKSINQTLKAQV